MALLFNFGEVAVVFHFLPHTKKHRAMEVAQCVENLMGKYAQLFRNPL
jgi:hypothetical protein